MLSFVIFRQLYNPMMPLWNTRQRWWHLSVIVIVLAFDVVALTTSSISGVWPMGVCLPGVSNKEELGVFLLWPLILSTLISILLLVGAAYLLRRQLRRTRGQTNRASRQGMKDLLNRFQLYSVGNSSSTDVSIDSVLLDPGHITKIIF